jgi:tetratricopeptide (TPR) repeat protein
MGAVFRAFDEGKQRVVALKLLENVGASVSAREQSNDARLIALFEREYETLALLTHPRVIEVYDYGIAEHGARYYTMELLDGGDLTTRAQLSWLNVCSLLRDVCTSLVLLHAQQLVHRDVNPRNVRLDRQGRAKLIDFGALTSFGVAGELVGTPACMAPEVLRGQALDARTDLFSLGAVAYWALTGRTPYAIRKLDDAELAWRTPPSAPSLAVPSIPKALDELLLSLLSIDPLGRPASAAEVIDRLSVIGQLQDEALAEIAESHIASSRLVGRASEQAQLELLLERTLRGHGGATLIEGAVGLGRSRLLSQLTIDAQLMGFTTLHVRGAREVGAGRVLRALAEQLLELAPDEARALLPKYLNVLGPLLAEASKAEDLVGDNEQMLRRASALARWLVEVSGRRPLLVAIDDAHLLHPSSAGVLTSIAELSQDARLLLAVTRLSAAPAAPAVEQLHWMGSVLSLTPIDEACVAQLAHSIFGDVPHRARVARWLAETGSGAPGRILERLRELVARGLIHYAGGAWVLPSELNDESLAEAVNADAAEQLARLRPSALSLARFLALHRGRLPESLCCRLLPSSEPSAVLAALAELTEAKVVSALSEGYALAEGSWRSLLIEGLEPSARPKLHLLLAKTLRNATRDGLAGLLSGQVEGMTTAEIVAAINVGLHFLRAGERSLGEALLRRGAIELTVRGDGLMAAAPDLEAAIETMRAQGRPRHRYGVLMTVLTLAGTYTDWRLGYRYGEDLLDLLAEAAGIKLAHRLTRFVGPKLALWLGLATGFLVFQLLPQRRMATSFREVILGLMGIGSAVLGVCSVLQDAERATRVVKTLSPLAAFPRKHVVHIVHQFQISLDEHSSGRYRTAVETGERVLSYVQSEAAKAAMPADARPQFEAGVQLMLGQLNVLRTDARALETLRALDHLQSGTSRQTAVSVRVAYHGHRGEREAFIKNMNEMDRLASESGAMWRNDLMIPRMLWTTLALCEDVMGLKRGAQQLTALASQVPTVAVMRDLTHACYLAEHGLPDEALALYAPLFEQAIGVNSLRAAQYLGAYARILRKAGQPERAKQICEQLLCTLTPADHEFTMLTFGARFELPLALLALAEHTRAAELLDALIVEHKSHDNPLLHGLTHGARAEVALAMNDRSCFEQHLGRMENWLRDTQHPALYAQYQRLAERGRTRLLRDVLENAAIPTLPRPSRPSSGNALVSLEPETPHGLLERAVREAGSIAGYVYLLRADGTLELSSATQDEPPPESCTRALGELLKTQANVAFETEMLASPLIRSATADDSMTLVEDVAGTPLHAEWPGRRGYWFALNGSSTSTAPAGAIVLSEGEKPLKRLTKRTIEQLSKALTRSV